MKKVLHSLALFGSFSTLICCALPALLVAIGAGASLAGAVSTFPQLIWISENKVPIFITAGILQIVSGILQWRAQKQSCPIDPNLREACESNRSWTRPVYLLSLGLYLVGFFFAFIAPSL